MSEPITEKTEPRKWFQQWWGIAIISAVGVVLPQLCNLIPNVVGAGACNVIVKATTFAFTGAVNVSPDVAVPVEECPTERRLSTGQCLPPVVNPIP